MEVVEKCHWTKKGKGVARPKAESLGGSMHRSKDNYCRTKGSWKKRAFCWWLVEASNYRLQGLSLAEGWYTGWKTSDGVTEAG